MPWTIDSVDEHKKGLSSKQKKQWVKVANSVYDRCMKDGGSDKTCAPSAIRQANGVVGVNCQIQINFKNDSYEVREEIHQGKKYIVVPITMVVEGVHNGSHGPLLHTIEDLGMFPASWDGIPIMIGHPEKDGQNVSANSPGLIDSDMVGRVYNTHVDGTKLKAEGWLDPEKLEVISSETLTNINEGNPIEVSVGVFTEDEPLLNEGDWNGEKYNAIARNHRPDHLALLPGEVGACSLDDGCGIRSNKKKGGDKMNDNVKVIGVGISLDNNKVFQAMKLLNDNGYSFNNILNNKDGYTITMDAVRRTLSSMDTSDKYHYLEELYDDYLIYCVRGQDSGEKMFKQEYSISDDDVVELIGNPTQVRKQVDVMYVANTAQKNKFNRKNKEVSTMADDAKKPCSGQCMEKVIAIINSNKTNFTEADREWLLVQEETVLDKLMPKDPVVVNSKKEEKPETVQVLSDEDKADLAWAKQQRKEKHRKLIEGIQANVAKDTWTDVELNSMNDNILEKIFSSVKKEEVELVDYSLNGGKRIVDNSNDFEPLYPAGIEMETKK